MMSDSQLPSNVHLLKPRTTSLSDRLDRFLEQHALAPDEAPVRRDPTRPRAPGVNAIRCASCEQMEYLTRDYCRCGHYLRGQLEDEFLAWQDHVFKAHEQSTEEYSAKVARLRLINLICIPLFVLPAWRLIMTEAPMTFSLLLFPMSALAVMGLVAYVEQRLKRPVVRTANTLLKLGFESYLRERDYWLLTVGKDA